MFLKAGKQLYDLKSDLTVLTVWKKLAVQHSGDLRALQAAPATESPALSVLLRGEQVAQASAVAEIPDSFSERLPGR